jgi:hypothetical protein
MSGLPRWEMRFIQFASPGVRPKIFAGMRAALRPGGLLLIEGYRPKQLDYRTGGPSQIENLYTRELLESAFAGLSSLDIFEYDSIITEGDGHVGTHRFGRHEVTGEPENDELPCPSLPGARRHAGSTSGVLPCDGSYFRAIDADIGEFAIA